MAETSSQITANADSTSTKLATDFITEAEFPVIDAHLHLTCRSAVGSYPPGVQDWFDDTGVKFGHTADTDITGDFSEAEYISHNQRDGAADNRSLAVNIRKAVFVEVLPEGEAAVREAFWVLNEFVDVKESLVSAVVAHIPVTGGAEAVKQYLVREFHFASAERGAFNNNCTSRSTCGQFYSKMGTHGQWRFKRTLTMKMHCDQQSTPHSKVLDKSVQISIRYRRQRMTNSKVKIGFIVFVPPGVQRGWRRGRSENTRRKVLGRFTRTWKTRYFVTTTYIYCVRRDAGEVPATDST